MAQILAVYCLISCCILTRERGAREVEGVVTAKSVFGGQVIEIWWANNVMAILFLDCMSHTVNVANNHFSKLNTIIIKLILTNIIIVVESVSNRDTGVHLVNRHV